MLFQFIWIIIASKFVADFTRSDLSPCFWLNIIIYLVHWSILHFYLHLLFIFSFLAIMVFEGKNTFEFDISSFLVDIWWSNVVINSDLDHIINQLIKKNYRNILKLCYSINTICMKGYFILCFWNEVFGLMVV